MATSVVKSCHLWNMFPAQRLLHYLCTTPGQLSKVSAQKKKYYLCWAKEKVSVRCIRFWRQLWNKKWRHTTILNQINHLKIWLSFVEIFHFHLIGDAGRCQWCHFRLNLIPNSVLLFLRISSTFWMVMEVRGQNWKARNVVDFYLFSVNDTGYVNQFQDTDVRPDSNWWCQHLVLRPEGV